MIYSLVMYILIVLVLGFLSAASQALGSDSCGPTREALATVFPSGPLPAAADDLALVYRAAKGLGIPAAAGRREDSPQRRWRNESTALGQSIPEGVYYGDCKFDYALEVLAERKRRLGPDHPYLEIWLRNQHAVFESCRLWGGDEEAEIEPASGYGAEVDALAKADRAYQEASRSYYLGEEGVRPAFAAIAADRKSPHRPAAAYMVALLRLMEALESSDRVAKVKPVMAAVDRILADRSLAPVHRIARQLYDIMAWWLRKPDLLEEQLAEIAHVLTLPADAIDGEAGLAKSFAAAREDLTWFLPLLGGGGPHAAVLEKSAVEVPFLQWLRLRRQAQARETVSDWLAPRGDGQDEALIAESLSRFDGGEGLPWATAALAFMGPSHPRTASLLALAEEQHRKAVTCRLTLPEAADHPLLLLHAVRLLALGGDPESAVTWIEEEAERAPPLLSEWAARRLLQWSIARGRLDLARRLAVLPVLRHETALRQLVARDLGEFLAAENPNVLSPGAIAVLNRLPVARLAEAAASPSLPVRHRAAIARMAWTRAFVLRGVDAAIKLSPLIAQTDQRLAYRLSKIKEGWTLRHRENRALLFLLRTPRMGLRLAGGLWSPYGQARELRAEAIDHFNPSDNNWWCPVEPDREARLIVRNLYDRPVGIPQGDLSLTDIRERTLAEHPVLRLVDESELAALALVPGGPQFLSERTVAWAKSSNLLSRLLGQDKGLAEALALAVQSTRHGCQRAGGHGTYSRAAFQELHKRFPGSSFAEETPYWFDCTHFRLGCAGPYSLPLP
ncbi:MAG: hypothetical protein H7841_01855 [Magnetospirillum sp. WYHS-4]